LIFLMPALTRLDSAKSTSRYKPPNGTADFARSSGRGASRLPAAPARTMPRTRRFANLPTSRPAGKPKGKPQGKTLRAGVPSQDSAKTLDQLPVPLPQPRGEVLHEAA